MRAVIQRAAEGRVSVAGEIVGAIGPGLVVLLGVARGDGEDEARWMADKIAGLRIFDDGDGKMNLSIADAAGEVLLVSQFTLLADCRKGRRPSFVDAAEPSEGERLYEAVARALASLGLRVRTGRFGARMRVEIENDGPVTIVLDSRDRANPRRSAAGSDGG